MRAGPAIDRRSFCWAFGALVLLACGCRGIGSEPRPALQELLSGGEAEWRMPVRVTAQAGGVLEGDYREEQRLLVFGSLESGNPDLWLATDAPQGLNAPRLIAPHSARDVWPRFGPQGRRLVFTSGRQDAGGDLWLFWVRRGRLVRAARWLVSAGGLLPAVAGERDLHKLTGPESSDDQPCWHPDGRRVFFSSAPRLGGRSDLWQLDLKTGDRLRLTQGGGLMPDCSPDGRFLVFASAAPEGAGSVKLSVIRLSDLRSTAITTGSDLDLYPCWSVDGRKVYFTRYGLDTNRDGLVDQDDRAAVFSVRFSEEAFFDGREPAPVRQLTSYRFSTLKSRPVPGGFLMAGNRGPGGDMPAGNLNLWALGEDGEVPGFGAVSGFLAFARKQAASDDAGPWEKLLAWQNVMWAVRDAGSVELDLESRDEAAEAWLASSDLLTELGLGRAARAVLDEAGRGFPDSAAVRCTAEARVLALDRADIGGMRPQDARWHLQEHLARARGLLDKCKREAEPLSAAPPERELRHAVPSLRSAAALSLLEAGLAQAALAQYPQALEDLDRVTSEYGEQVGPCAQAMLAKAEVYKLLRDPESVRMLHMALLKTYPDARPYTQQAAGFIVDSITGPASTIVDPGDKVAKLRELVERPDTPPVLAALAQNRIGDVFYEVKDYLSARRAYEETIERFAGERRQLASAYLALAVIDAEQENYADSLGRYRQLQERLGASKVDEVLYRRAQGSYVNSMLMKAARELEVDDVPLAASTYEGLVRFYEGRKEFAPGLVAVHRGLVGCQHRMGHLEEMILRYREALKVDPRDDLSGYALALCYSYYGPSDWVGRGRPSRLRAGIDREALALLDRAILLRYEVSYYHQLRGFLYGRIAEAENDDDARMQSLDSYLTALALSDQERDRVGYADAVLNVAEGYYAVDRHDNAVEHYRRALAAGLSLSGIRGEVVLEHMSRSAIVSGSYSEAAGLLQAAIDRLTARAAAPGPEEEVQRLRRRAMLLDTLGLARYLDQDYSAAAESYEQCIGALMELGRRDPAGSRRYGPNLLRARRNLAVNIYNGVESGGMPAARLQQAWDLLQSVLEKVDQVGAVDREERAGGLITIGVEVAMGKEVGLARFDTAAEKRLAYTYLARISQQAGDSAGAAGLLQKKLTLYPKKPIGKQGDGVLSEQAKVWSQLADCHASAGDLRRAAEAFTRAMELGRDLQARMDYCRSLGHMALRIAALPEQQRGMLPDEMRAWLATVVEYHRRVLAEAAASPAEHLAALSLGLNTNIAELVPLVEETGHGN